jgi:hypothetical protein
MAKKRVAKRSKGKRPKVKRSARTAMPREVRAAYGEMQRGVEHLDASIADLRSGLRRAERQIEADARRRISNLRKEARGQLKGLQAKQREAARMLRKLSVAAGESWREIKRSADSTFADARATAAVIARRFRRALKAG